MRRLSMLIGLVVALAAPAAAQPTTVDTFPGKVIVASTASDALTVAGDVIVHSTGSGNKVLTLGSSPSTNATALIKLVGSNTQTNWQIGTNGTTAGAFELTPSTAGGGTTFTTPVVTVSSTGLATFSGIGRHIIGGGGVAASSLLRIDGGNASGLGSYVSFAKAGTDKAHVGLTSGILASGTSDDLALFSAAGVGIYSLSALRWGVNSAGDFTYGTSSHTAFSGGTPSFGVCTGGGCSGAVSAGSTDYAMTVTATSSTSVSVTFGHSMTGSSSCTATSGAAGTVFPYFSSLNSTGFTLNGSGGSNVPATVYIHCAGG